MSITLPPLKNPLVSPDGSLYLYEVQLRARDQEIVRCVLEAAGLTADQHGLFGVAKAIRALEFKHVE